MSTLEVLFQAAASRDRVGAERSAQLLLFLVSVASLACLVVAAFLFNPIAGFAAAGVAGLITEQRLTQRRGTR